MVPEKGAQGHVQQVHQAEQEAAEQPRPALPKPGAERGQHEAARHHLLAEADEDPEADEGEQEGRVELRPVGADEVDQREDDHDDRRDDRPPTRRAPALEECGPPPAQRCRRDDEEQGADTDREDRSLEGGLRRLPDLRVRDAAELGDEDDGGAVADEDHEADPYSGGHTHRSAFHVG